MPQLSQKIRIRGVANKLSTNNQRLFSAGDGGRRAFSVVFWVSDSDGIIEAIGSGTAMSVVGDGGITAGVDTSSVGVVFENAAFC